MTNNNRYKRAISRNLFELGRLFSYRTAINELIRVSPTTNWSFFSYAYLAMYEAVFFHAMKILDEHREAVSFWYIWRCNQGAAEKYLSKCNLTYDEIKNLSGKLKLVRNKTHFHNDRNEIFNPNDVWTKADIVFNFFNKVMDNISEVLRMLYSDQFGEQYHMSIYNGKDIENILQAVQEKGITI